MRSGSAQSDVSDTVAFLHDYLRVTSRTRGGAAPDARTIQSPSRPAPPLPPDDNSAADTDVRTPQPAEAVLASTTTTTTTAAAGLTGATEERAAADIAVPQRYSWRHQVGSFAIHQTTLVEGGKAQGHTSWHEGQPSTTVTTTVATRPADKTNTQAVQDAAAAPAPHRSVVPHIRTAAASHRHTAAQPHSPVPHTSSRVHHAAPLFESSASNSLQQQQQTQQQQSLRRLPIIPPPGPMPDEDEEEQQRVYAGRHALNTRVPVQHERRIRHHPLAFAPPQTPSHSLLTSGSPHHTQAQAHALNTTTASRTNESTHKTRLMTSTRGRRASNASASEQLSFVPVQSIEALYYQGDENSTRSRHAGRSHRAQQQVSRRHHYKESGEQTRAHNTGKMSTLLMNSSLVFPDHSSPTGSSRNNSSSSSTRTSRASRSDKQGNRTQEHRHHREHHPRRLSASSQHSHSRHESVHSGTNGSSRRHHSTRSAHRPSRHRHTSAQEDKEGEEEESTQTPAPPAHSPVKALNAATSTSQAALDASLSFIATSKDHTTILRHIVRYLKGYYARDAAAEAQRGIATMSCEDLLGLVQCVYMDFYHLIRAAQLRQGLNVAETGYAAADPPPLVTTLSTTSSSSSLIHRKHEQRGAAPSPSSSSAMRARSHTHTPSGHHHHQHHYTGHTSRSVSVSQPASHHSSHRQAHEERKRKAHSASSHQPSTHKSQHEAQQTPPPPSPPPGKAVQVIEAKVPIFVSPCSSPRSAVLSSSSPSSRHSYGGRGGGGTPVARPLCTPMPSATPAAVQPQGLGGAVNRPYSVSSHSRAASSSVSTSAPHTRSASTSHASRRSSSHAHAHHHHHYSNTPHRHTSSHASKASVHGAHAVRGQTSRADGMVNSATSHSLHTDDTQVRSSSSNNNNSKAVRAPQQQPQQHHQHTPSKPAPTTLQQQYAQSQADMPMLHRAASSLRASHKRPTPSPRKSVSIAPSASPSSSSSVNNETSAASRLQTLMAQLRQGVNALKYVSRNRPPHLRYFRVEDRFASFRGSGVLMPHLVWKVLNQRGATANNNTSNSSSVASARMRAEGLNLIQLRAVTKGSGTGPACPGYELFYRKHGHVIDRKGDVVPEHLCAVLVFTAKTLAVSFLREQDQLLWMEALTGVVQRNQTLRF